MLGYISVVCFVIFFCIALEGKDLRKEQYKKGDPKAGLFKHPPNKLHERKGVKEIYSPTQTNSGTQRVYARNLDDFNDKLS